MTPSRAIVAALLVLAVNLDAQSPTLDPTMTRSERAELIDLLNNEQSGTAGLFGGDFSRFPSTGPSIVIRWPRL
jgi:hypothetical protein